MARTITFRYEDPDSTFLWNEMYRRMFHPGVYMGFTVEPGSLGNWWLKFTHETDPDNTSSKLGIIYTRDGAVIRENADQDNVMNGSVSLGLPNIHYVIASYTYNASTPPNDVVYFVRQGTPGTPPTPPSLGADEILLAEIYVPSGASSYSSPGVEIRNVGHLSLYGTNVDVVTNLQGVLKPGIYTGLYSFQGTAWNKVSLAAGQWVTKESHLISESSDLPDKFTLTDPGNGYYRYAWIIGAHKWGNENPIPAPDYVLVEGTAVAVGSSADLPSDTAVRTAVATLNPKYDTDGDTLAESIYINYLGYIRVENRSSTYYVDYIRGETFLGSDTLHVYGARASSFQRSGAYYGHQGLLQAIEDVYAVSKSIYPLNKPYTIILDGDFDLADTALRLPSHIRLQGNGAPSRIRANSDDVILAQGFEAVYNSVNQTITQALISIPNTPPGYQGRQFTIQPTYRVGDSIIARKFCKGDRVFIYKSGIPGYSGEAIFVENVSDWTFNLWVNDAYNAAGNPVNIDLFILKSDVHVENLEIDRITTGAGALRFNLVDRCSADQIRCRKFSNDVSYNSRFGFIEITNAVSWGNAMNYPSPIGYWGRNTYRHIKFSTFTPAEVGALGEAYSQYDFIEFGDPSQYSTAITATVRLFQGYCKAIRFYSYLTGALEITGNYANVGLVYGQYCNVKLTTRWSVFGRIERGGATTLEFGTGCQDTTIVNAEFTANSVIDTAGTPTNRILVGGAFDTKLGMVENANSDRNLRMVSSGNFSWNSTTGLLTWTDSIRFDNPWTTGYSSLAAGSATLSADGDRLYVDIDRTATGTSVVTASVQSKSSSGSNIYAKHRVFVAVRDQGVIYLFDGTRLESGATVKLGQTPPPDGSVTYAKLAGTALEFHNKFFRDYVILDADDNSLWGDDIIVRNVNLLTFTYTPSTGVIQYNGNIDLSAVRPGDFIILRETDWAHGISGRMAYTFEEILDVNNTGNNVTIARGLSLTVGSANIWNGAIGRGNKVFTNDGLVSFTYSSGSTTPGRITFSTGLGFSQYMVRPGYLFVDSAGQKHVIVARDTSGAGAWIDIMPGRRYVDTTPPTSKFHGCVERNNNPHNIPMADLRSTFGMEYIPIYGVGAPAPETAINPLATPVNKIGNVLSRCYYSFPYDPRVRIYMEPGDQGPFDQMVRDEGGTDFPYEPNNWAMWSFVDITAVCTGMIFLFSTPFGGQVMGTIDGEEMEISGFGDLANTALNYSTDDLSNANLPLLPYNVDTPSSGYRILRLPQGVHTVRVVPSSELVGVLILNYPEQYDKTFRIYENPGRAVQRGGVKTYSYNRGEIMPTSTEAWNKGGRVLRYADKNGVRKFASRWVRAFVDSGTTSTGSADITSVGNASQWRVGDLIMIVNGGNKNLRRIVGIAGSTITVNASYSFTAVGTTLYYYGSTLRGPSSTIPNGAEERFAEEIAAYFPLKDFPGSGSSGGTSIGKYPGNTNIDTICVSQSNNEDTIVQPGPQNCPSPTAQGIRLDAGVSNGWFDFLFIGTGVSILGSGEGSTVTVYVDNVDCGVLPSYSDQSGYTNDGGQFIAGNLPYGLHTVRVAVTGTGVAYISGYAVWWPKLPEVPAADKPILELMDNCTVGVEESTLSINPVTGNATRRLEPSMNTIRQNAVRSCGCDKSMVFKSHCGDWPGILPEVVMWNAGESSLNASLAFVFFGDAITITYFGRFVNSSSIRVEFLDTDGRWKQPSALTGFSVTGVDGWTTNDNTTVINRERWVCSRLGIHYIRFRGQAVSQEINIDGIEVHCPAHTRRVGSPWVLRHHLPFQHSGYDRRNLTPFDTSTVTKSRAPIVMSASYSQSWETLDWYMQPPFWFFSHGGWVDLEVQFQVNYLAVGSRNLTLYIDNLPAITSSPYNPTSGGAFEHTLRGVFQLTPGWHWCYVEPQLLNWNGIGEFKWKAVAYEMASNGPQDRVQGPPSHYLGPFGE